MDAIVITGNGPLEGVTHASGAKNAALPIIASALLAPGEHTFRNVPELVDVNTMFKVLDTMGCESHRLEGKKKNIVTIKVPTNVTPEAPYDLVRTMRSERLGLAAALGGPKHAA